MPNKTCIFFDEIRSCPNARTSLKSFALDKRFDVIACGSLLGIISNDNQSIPVGYEQQIFMYPIDFEEYLWVKGITTSQIDDIKLILKKILNKEKVDLSRQTNEVYLDWFTEYMVVGGMPEAVATFLETNNYDELLITQQKIVNSYRDDLTKYPKEQDKIKVRNIYDTIPHILSKESKKFKYIQQ